MKRLNDIEPIEVAKDIWWVGFADYESGFANNPFLLIDEDEVVLFDPGPGHPFFEDIIVDKIRKVVKLERIKYIVTHHQDPDICGLIPFIENLIAPDVVIIAHPRTALFLPYYGIRSRILPIGDGDSLQLNSGRIIKFYHTPYLHSPGAIVSYDETTKTLFSSDIFGGFDRNWNLYADSKYIERAQAFLEQYSGSKEALVNAYNKFQSLDITNIFPQHGSLITHDEDIKAFINLLNDINPSELLRELTNKGSAKQLNDLFLKSKELLELWLKASIDAENLDDLIDMAFMEGQATVALLYDFISQKSKILGIANPLNSGKIHKSNKIKAVSSDKLIDSFRNRALLSQYGLIKDGDSDNIDVLVKKRLTAIRDNKIIMFIDVRQFTKWSESRSPDEIIGMLNKIHSISLRLITSNQGRINKVLGDGLLAYFSGDNIDNAFLVCTDILESINNEQLLPVGIGVTNGEVIFGDIGEDQRIDYSLIGKTVNLASRLCDSAGKNQFVISMEMFNALSDSVKSGFDGILQKEEISVQVKPYDPLTKALRFTLIQ